MSDAGVIYMCFGKPALAGLEKSVRSLRSSGNKYPVAIVGDVQVDWATCIPWTGESPFDAKQRTNFRFRAGRVKPTLARLSPFKKTLYLDCDTEILGGLAPAFTWLDRYELLIAKHVDERISDLYNKPRAGWYHNIQERNATIQELGTGDLPYWNSGVIFWRKSPATDRLFDAWAAEWRRWQEWDEQLSLMRAAYHNPLHILVLPETWNHPHRAQARIIFHNYGRGVVRTNG